nr:LmbU family transcriptional regulator [Kibdelosporangium sp. MJ126-NF4]CEL13201.1 conserved hypothetical protein present in several antibiotic biosynthetic clusters [Kibdelosporangium sp. MJ126-NF4]
MTRVGLQIPPGLSFSDWERTGRRLSDIVDSSAWWLGDWLVYGKKNYADRYHRAIQAAGLRYQTLRNYAWVARQFDLERRRSELTFQHHTEVASLPLDEQDRLLDQAVREEWTTKQLRSAIQLERTGSTKQERSADDGGSRIEVPNSRLGTWQRAAACSGVELANWVLTTLDQAAEEVLNERVVQTA